jgi:hypothetical protein
MIDAENEYDLDDGVPDRRPQGRPTGQSYPFRAWRIRLGLTITEAGRLLGRERAVNNYEKLTELPQHLQLAMLALEYLPSWRLAEVGIVPYWRREPPRRPYPSRS